MLGSPPYTENRTAVEIVDLFPDRLLREEENYYWRILSNTFSLNVSITEKHPGIEKRHFLD